MPECFAHACRQAPGSLGTANRASRQRLANKVGPMLDSRLRGNDGFSAPFGFSCDLR